MNRLDTLRKRWPVIASPTSFAAYVRRNSWLRDDVEAVALECCAGCRHLCHDDQWCALQSLPASFNPILTPMTGMVGMACMGAGYESPGVQTELSL